MATTECLVERAGSGWIITIPLPPVPASRPRVSKWGTYYLKTYATWKAEAERLLSEYKVPGLLEKAVHVEVHSFAKRPKKLTRPYPRADVDNYAKAVLDAITKSECLWKDDDQVIQLTTTKRYAEPGEEPCTRVYIEEK